MEITLAQAAARLRQMEDVGILVHENPDGDCIGSGYALLLALRALGKRARVLCSDPIPEKFRPYLPEEGEAFEPAHYVSVDTATPALLGRYGDLAEKVEVCIDHHPSNSSYARETVVQPEAAAVCEMIFSLVEILGVSCTRPVATCLYIGLITDTGCFQFSNTTAHTHRVAAALMEQGVDYATLNRLFFSTKSRARLRIEKCALENLEFFEGDKLAITAITLAMKAAAGADDGDLEGVTPIPRQIEGVEIGVTLREKAPDSWRVSVRTNSIINAAEVCAQFGGGGHVRAAGCRMEGPLPQVKAALVEVCAQYLRR